VRDWWTRLLHWWEYDHKLARHAMREWVKQEAGKHPAEKGEHWR